MLAKEIKIKMLKMQREFIENRLKKIPAERKDGDSSYVYVGDIYPEVINYFESEGFVVTLVKSELVQAFTKGKPLYIFTIDKNIALTQEELKQAEEYEENNEEDQLEDSMEIELLKELFMQ